MEISKGRDPISERRYFSSLELYMESSEARRILTIPTGKTEESRGGVGDERLGRGGQRIAYTGLEDIA